VCVCAAYITIDEYPMILLLPVCACRNDAQLSIRPQTQEVFWRDQFILNIVFPIELKNGRQFLW
jgi:hypothetical protein